MEHNIPHGKACSRYDSECEAPDVRVCEYMNLATWLYSCNATLKMEMSSYALLQLLSIITTLIWC